MKLVLTRPYDDSFRLKMIIESESKHSCVIEPLLEIKNRQVIIPEPGARVFVLSSANAARAMAENTRRRDHKIIAVGEYSANETRKLGFTNVRSASMPGENNNEGGLFEYINANIDKGTEIYHISADVITGGLEEKLKDAEFEYIRVIAYDVMPKDFSMGMIKGVLENEFDGFVFYSARTAEVFSDNIMEHNLSGMIYGKTAFCLSNRVVKSLYGLDFGRILIPEVTSGENFIKLITQTK